MRKLVIANSGTAGRGKTSAVKAVYQLLKDKGYNLLVEEWQGVDIKAIFDIDGFKADATSLLPPAVPNG